MNTTMQIEDLILPVPDSFQDEFQHAFGANDYAASSTGLPRLDRGFYFKSPTAGTFQVITLRKFRQKLFDKGGANPCPAISDTKKISDGERNDILQAITADGNKETIRLGADEYNSVPLVFVDRSNAASSTIYVGVI
jgi:hypothetical protein